MSDIGKLDYLLNAEAHVGADHISHHFQKLYGSLEPEMISALIEIAGREQLDITKIYEVLSLKNVKSTQLGSFLRRFILNYFRCAATDEGHTAAGHGPRH